MMFGAFGLIYTCFSLHSPFSSDMLQGMGVFLFRLSMALSTQSHQKNKALTHIASANMGGLEIQLLP